MSGKLSRKADKNAYFLSLLSKCFGVIVGLIFTIFQSRYLGAEIKGQVAVVNSIVSITSIVFGFGICYAYPYFKRKLDYDILPIFLRVSLFFLVVYLTISGLAILIFRPGLKYLSVLILTPLLVYDTIVSYVTLIEVPGKRSIVDMVINLSEIIMIGILWVFVPASFLIGILVITLKDICKACLFTFWWRKRIFVPSESIWGWIPKLVKAGFFPMLCALMATLNYRVDVLMLDGKVPDAAVGVYSVGVLLAERIWLIPDAMKGVMESNLAKGKDASETAFVIRVCNTLCVFLVLGVVALGKPFLDILFGAEYSGAYQVTLILLFGVFSMIYYKLIEAYNKVMGHQKVSFFMLSGGVVCNVIANLLLIPKMGIYGAGLASVVSYAACSFFFIIYFCRKTGVPFREMLIIDKEDFERVKRKFQRNKGKKETPDNVQ